MSLSITDQCPVNTNILAPKTGALHTGPPKYKIVILSKTTPTISIKFQSFKETISQNKTA
jgi:hypothetical protein